MANSINIDGTEYRIEGDDLATEATLRRLVEAVNRMASGRGSGGGPPGGGAAAAGENLSQQYQAAADNLDDMSGSVIRYGQENEKIIRLQTGTAKGFDLLGAAMKGLRGAIKLLDIAFTTAVGIVSYAFGVVDQMSEGVKDLYSAGIRLQGGFSELARTAGLAGMSVAELGKVMIENRAAVSRFGGGNMIEGAKRMSAFSKELVFGKANLAGLGIGVAEAAGYIADYSDIQMRLTKQDITKARAGENANDVQKRVTQSTANYISDLDSLARTTGKTREEMHELIADLSKDVDITSTLDALGLAAEQKENITEFAAMIKAMPGGEGMLQGFKSLLQIGTMTGDMAAAFATVGPQLQGEMAGIAADLKSGAIDEKTARDRMMDAMTDNAEQISITLGRIPEEQRTQAQKDLLAMANSAKEREAARKKEIEDYMNNNKERKMSFAQAEKELNDQRSAELKAQTDLDAMKKKFSTILNSLVLKIFGSQAFMNLFDKAMKGLEKFGDFLLNAIGKVDPYIKKFDAIATPIIEKLWTTLSTIFGQVMEALRGVNLGELFKNIYTVFSVISRTVGNILANIDLNAVFLTLQGFFKEVAGFVNQIFAAVDFKMIGTLFNTVFGTVSDVIKDLWERVKGLFASQEGGMAGALGKVIGAVSKYLNYVVKVLKLLYQYVLSPILDILGPIIGTIVNLLVGVIDVFGSIADFWSTVIDFFTGDASFSQVFDKFKAVWSAAFSTLFTLLKDFGKIIASPFVALFNLIKQAVMDLKGGVIKLFEGVGAFFTDLITSAKNFFANFSIEKIVTGLIDTVKNVFTGIAQWWADFSFMDMLEAVKQKIVDLFSSIGSYIAKKLNPLNWFSDDDDDKKKPAPAAAPAAPAAAPALTPQQIAQIPEDMRTPAQKEILAKSQAAAPATPAAAAPAQYTSTSSNNASEDANAVNIRALKNIGEILERIAQITMAIEDKMDTTTGDAGYARVAPRT